MFASLLRPKKRRLHAVRSPFSSWNTQDGPSLRNQTQNNDYREFIGNNVHDVDEDEDSMDADGQDDPSAPLLPIFSASHLGMNTKPGKLKRLTNMP